MIPIDSWIIWLIVAAVLVVIEVSTLKFHFLWASIGAIAGSISSLLHSDAMWIDFAVCVVVMALLEVCTRPLTAPAKAASGTTSKSGDIIGKVGTVEENISYSTMGIIRVDGHIFHAKSGDLLKPGDKAKVIAQSGIVLTVEKQFDEQVIEEKD